MRVVGSYFVSALLHALVVGAMLHLSLRQATWEYAVDNGQAVTLSASLAAAPPQSSPVALEAVQIKLSAAPVSRSEATPTLHEPAKQAAEPPEIVLAVGELEVQVAAVNTPHPHEVSRSPNDYSQPQATAERSTTNRRRQPSQITPPSTSTAASVGMAAVRYAGANVDRPPRKMPTNRAPDYPMSARVERSEGRVLLLVRINEQGRVDELAIRKSSGDPRLDDAAESAVRFWRFYPAEEGGTAVAAEVLVPVRFSLRQI